MAKIKDSKFPKFSKRPKPRNSSSSKDVDGLFIAFDECVWPYKSYTQGLFVDSLPRRIIISAKDLDYYTTNYRPFCNEKQRWLVFNEDNERVEMFEYHKPKRDYKTVEDI